eukprot:TRINITY_DN7710_c0_g1_i1.p5 TRINITY_DN7710_c0_g1~~TRINITY_DN7710_c0_g1_i1.p5  ORF type:complete len:134 (+),score=31.24 TRINITY_DN7710_c0_g1_i1:1315-1716(+)
MHWRWNPAILAERQGRGWLQEVSSSAGLVPSSAKRRVARPSPIRIRGGTGAQRLKRQLQMVQAASPALRQPMMVGGGESISWRAWAPCPCELSLPPYSALIPVSYTHLRAHETPEHLVCRLLLEKKKKKKEKT